VNKPGQWADFDRCEREDEELVNDVECIGAVQPFGMQWLNVAISRARTLAIVLAIRSCLN